MLLSQRFKNVWQREFRQADPVLCVCVCVLGVWIGKVSLSSRTPQQWDRRHLKNKFGCKNANFVVFGWQTNSAKNTVTSFLTSTITVAKHPFQVSEAHGQWPSVVWMPLLVTLAFYPYACVMWPFSLSFVKDLFAALISLERGVDTGDRYSLSTKNRSVMTD